MPDTGPAVLPDIGECSYNGVRFNSLYTSTVSGKAIKDNANRTVKYMEYTITVDGMVTLPDGAATVDAQWVQLRKLLDRQAGVLRYSGKGFGPLVVNRGTIYDVAWGPVPEVLDFKPMGASRSAMVKWQVVTRIAEDVGRGPSRHRIAPGVGRLEQFPTLQFCFDSSVSYDESGFSSISLRGVIEIPLTRDIAIVVGEGALPGDRLPPQTADAYREFYMERIANSIDHSRFRVTKRSFDLSKDLRTLTWAYEVEELPYMKPPLGFHTAHGTYTVKPARTPRIVSANVQWVCTLRATYTLPNWMPRKRAWDAFAELVTMRKAWSVAGALPGAPGVGAAPPGPGGWHSLFPFYGLATDLSRWRDLRAWTAAHRAGETGQLGQAWIFDMQFEEGLYLDSKTVSFTASWMLFTRVNALLGASGFWRKVGARDGMDGERWGYSVRQYAGGQSWLFNEADPQDYVIIDLGIDDLPERPAIFPSPGVPPPPAPPDVPRPLAPRP